MAADVSQLNNLGRDLDAAGPKVAAALAALVERTAEKVETRARATAPVGETGDLKASISTVVHGPMSRSVVADVRYAVFVEYGVPSRNMAPQPFMDGAVDEAEETFVQAVERIRSGWL